MRLLSGQKAICVFLDLLATTICLALFLDNSSGDKQYIFLCLIVFATDAACFGVLFYNIYSELRTNGQQNLGIRAFWNFLYPFNNVYTGQFVCITCKVVFEVLIAIRLTFALSIPYIVYFIPFWIFCGIIFVDLTRRLYSVQKKINNH
ncbi:Serpentine Receptor, class E (Epsilon) [Caenorhabditis elegans]|uniref:Serpentine Receptor, class E (Epsilon) n=1 Tax=Caenorhabditis elegans TaxID=6239 RepID=Q19993_CAEEL|nr:Serpentine Receptor, class E (Epsilon) [Caenorhabditis elegans]CAA84315.1 Serpentine Receptor, class E (Epsilon) [Caenorhabditis elegans]|eukprot:NP_497757.1 Uncharacterized protein CELE_F34D10.3 [Caenorhabditis elegans]